MRDRIIAVLSVLLGGISLLVLGVFLWVGSFQVVSLGIDGAAVPAWDAALSLLFFVQHSGMIRRGFRVRLERVAPPHMQAAVYSAASGAAMMIVLGLWQRSSVVAWSIDPPWSVALRAAFVIAIFGFVAGVRALRGFDAFGLRPIRDRLRGRARPSGPLAVSGPYRWVRHPLYTAVLVLIWSCPTVTLDRLLFNLLWTGWMVVGTVLEERDLVREFGDDYLAYRKVVPMLIPWTLVPRWPAGTSF